MIDIALSSGWMFAHDIQLWREQEKFVKLVDGVELSVTTTNRFNTYNIPINTSHTSFHIAPNSDHIQQVNKLVDIQNPSLVVLHPTESRELIAEYSHRDIPLGIENMDAQTDVGVQVDSLQQILEKYDAKFVLDVQHAFEHDSEMDYAWELVEMAGEKLTELHVSGETVDHNHSLVHTADNRESILDFLHEFYASGYDIPIVIEGEYRTKDDVKTEFEVLREAINR